MSFLFSEQLQTRVEPPNLQDLHYFAAIVEHGSFSAAARALSVANSVLSEHMRDLESRLGLKLIERTTRQLHITEMGMRIYQHCRRIDEEARQLVQVVSDATRDGGVLRMATNILAAQNFVSVSLGAFMREHSGVRAELDVSNRSFDILEENYDIVFQVNQAHSRFVSRELVRIELALYASREFVRTHSSPESPQQLSQFRTLAYADDDGHCVWTLSNQRETCKVRLEPQLATRHSAVVLETMLGSVGIGLLPKFLVQKQLRSGEVVRILTDWTPAHWTLYAVYASRQGLRSAARKYLQFLAEYMPSTAFARMEGVHIKAMTRKSRTNDSCDSLEAKSELRDHA